MPSLNPQSPMLIEKIVSGAQTGVDRAAIDAAIEAGVDYGGWLPKGRKAEDGPVDAKYDRLQEMTSADYLKRTEQNVKDSDATMIFCHGAPTGGTKRTIGFCEKWQRPYYVFDLDVYDYDTPPPVWLEDEIEYLCWLCARESIVLNVAGPRESKSPGVYEKVRHIWKGFYRLHGAFKERSPLSMRHLGLRAEREGKEQRFVEREWEKEPDPLLSELTAEDLKAMREEERQRKKNQKTKDAALALDNERIAACYKEFHDLVEMEQQAKKDEDAGKSGISYCTRTVPWTMWEREALCRSDALQKEMKNFDRKLLIFLAHEFQCTIEEAFVKFRRFLSSVNGK